MRAISQLLLNFLVNAGWQIALIVAVASVCAWLIRSLGSRQRHALWVAGLFMSLGLPLLTCSQLFSSEQVSPSVPPASAVREVSPPPFIRPQRAAEPNSIAVPLSRNAPNRFIKMNSALASGVAGLYLLFLLYRGLKLSGAWRRTRIIRSSAHSIEPNEQNEKIFARCQAAIGVQRVQILCSAAISVPLTVGVRRPLVILPERLLRQIDADILASAVGHELVHVLRRDYLLNLVYELIYLPLSFHPAAALVRRKIKQTRELSCDELVTEKLLAAEVYAHSLVQLAGSAVPFGRQSNLTVGITDADILEVRIMSLLRKPKLNVRRRKLSLIAAALLFAVPFVAATAFGVRLDIKAAEVDAPAIPQSSYSLLQQKDGKARLIYKTEPEYTQDARANLIEGTVALSATIGKNGFVQDVRVTKPLYPSLDQSAVETLHKWRFEPMIKDGQPVTQQIGVELVFNLRAWEQDQEKAQKRERQETEERKRAESERKAEGQAEESEKRLEREERELKDKRYAEERELKEKEGAKHDPQFRAELEARARQQQEETKTRLIAHASLARMAKITMEQAIQIANGQYPGKVMECSLVGQGWESPGKLGKDGHALYHVVIISVDDVNPTFTHVMVNALDGTIYKTERAESRKETSTVLSGEKAPISGGVLNGRALSLPYPEYPVIARAARAAGSVTVGVTIDEQGNVIAARAESGHPLLQAASVNAARQARFAPTFLMGEPVKVTGVLTYFFVVR
jgi:TonB family protein